MVDYASYPSAVDGQTTTETDVDVVVFPLGRRNRWESRLDADADPAAGGQVAQGDVRAAHAGGRPRSSSSSQFGADAFACCHA
jgi:hypothetical protein